jgi:arylsulfatase A-like enzyme
MRLRPRVVAPIVAAAVAVTLVASARRDRGGPLDLLRATDRLVEVDVGGRNRDWLLEHVGRVVKIDDVFRKTLPAAPPSRLRFHLDIPKGGSLSFNYGVPEERQDRPAVEFVVKVRRNGREHTVWTSLVDPLGHPEHRRWLNASVDLSAHAGPDADLILETRGFAPDDDPRAAFWGVPALTVPRAAPLAIIYLVDTLRADHTQPYGYVRDTTPELLAFSHDAVVFDTAIVSASWTKPSVASILTSLLPGRHRAVQLRDPLDSGHVTLAEMLEAKGFATGAAIANWIIYWEGSNLGQGFEAVTGLHGAEGRPSKDVEAAKVVDAALEWVLGRRGLPTFLYVHTIDPHVPYTPPAPFDQKYEPHPAPGHPGVDPRWDYTEPLDRERLIAQYDGDIAYGDREFGRFIRSLKAAGLYDRALIVFMADHGEEFLDHQGWLHGRSVFDELIHVPLIVKFPGQKDAGRRIKQQVQAIDVLPTVLQTLGLPVPEPPTIDGRPLQPVLRGELAERPAVSEISHRGYVAHGMRTSRDKYIARFGPEEDELYFDLFRDPKEQVNRIDDNRERVRFLKAGVEAAMVVNPYRHHLKVEGTGEYFLRLRTGGWIEGVDATGLGEGERYESDNNGRKLYVRLRPKAGQPRELTFTLRPMGVRVWLEGTHDGRPLRPGEVRMAQDGAHPTEVPFRLPEIDDTDTERPDDERAARALVPPSGGPGLQLWLTLDPGRSALNFDKDSRERLKALGYLGPG